MWDVWDVWAVWDAQTETAPLTSGGSASSLEMDGSTGSHLLLLMATRPFLSHTLVIASAAV